MKTLNNKLAEREKTVEDLEKRLVYYDKENGLAEDLEKLNKDLKKENEQTRNILSEKESKAADILREKNILKDKVAENKKAVEMLQKLLEVYEETKQITEDPK